MAFPVFNSDQPVATTARLTQATSACLSVVATTRNPPYGLWTKRATTITTTLSGIPNQMAARAHLLRGPAATLPHFEAAAAPAGAPASTPHVRARFTSVCVPYGMNVPRTNAASA